MASTAARTIVQRQAAITEMTVAEERRNLGHEQDRLLVGQRNVFYPDDSDDKDSRPLGWYDEPVALKKGNKKVYQTV